MTEWQKRQKGLLSAGSLPSWLDEATKGLLAGLPHGWQGAKSSGHLLLLLNLKKSGQDTNWHPYGMLAKQAVLYPWHPVPTSPCHQVSENKVLQVSTLFIRDPLPRAKSHPVTNVTFKPDPPSACVIPGLSNSLLSRTNFRQLTRKQSGSNKRPISTKLMAKHTEKQNPRGSHPITMLFSIHQDTYNPLSVQATLEKTRYQENEFGSTVHINISIINAYYRKF